MPQIVQQGQINLAALNVPDLIVQIIPPQLLINGVPTNVVGMVGTATWGQTNSPVIVGGYADYVSKFGYPVARKYDMGTAVWAASQQGAKVFRCVRVTDGSDIAASAVVQSNCLTYTSLYSGSRGNGISVGLSAGSAKNTQKAVVSLGSMVPEVFDNIMAGVAALTVTAGTYTVCPAALTVGAPNLANGRQAAATPTLKLNSAPTVGAGGTGYVVNDLINLANGVVLKVATVSTGAVSTVTIQNAGAVTAGASAPATGAQVSSSGAGTGASFTGLVWGLAATIDDGGAGYTSAPTVSIVGGTGSGGSITAVTSYWPNIAAAINNGVSGLRGPSQIVTALAGVGTSNPTAASVTLSGGVDGGNQTSIGATGTPALIGLDTYPRTGMYAMRSAGVAIGMLVDCDDSTTWTTQTSFGLSEGIYMIGTGPVGDSIANAVSVKANAGVDSYAFKLMFGDWVYINDPISGAQRLISPQAFVAGFMGNQTPSETPMNKPMYGIVGTQKSKTNIQYTQADLQSLSQAGIDVICNPNPGGSYFGLRLGQNTSSEQSVWGDNYTRMTFFIARTVAAGCGAYVGRLQSATERQQAATTLNSFFANLQRLGMIGTPDGSPAFQVVLDKSNNPQNMVALGYQFAYCKVIYLSVIRYFVVDLEGGQTVTITPNLPNGATVTGGTVG